MIDMRSGQLWFFDNRSHFDDDHCSVTIDIVLQRGEHAALIYQAVTLNNGEDLTSCCVRIPHDTLESWIEEGIYCLLEDA